MRSQLRDANSRLCELEIELSGQLEAERKAKSAVILESEQLRQRNNATEEKRRILVQRLQEAEMKIELLGGSEAERDRLQEELRISLEAERESRVAAETETGKLKQQQQSLANARNRLADLLRAEETKRQAAEAQIQALTSANSESSERARREYKEKETALLSDLSAAQDAIANLQEKLQIELDNALVMTERKDAQYKSELDQAQQRHAQVVQE